MAETDKERQEREEHERQQDTEAQKRAGRNEQNAAAGKQQGAEAIDGKQGESKDGKLGGDNKQGDQPKKAQPVGETKTYEEWMTEEETQDSPQAKAKEAQQQEIAGKSLKENEDQFRAVYGTAADQKMDRKTLDMRLEALPVETPEVREQRINVKKERERMEQDQRDRAQRAEQAHTGAHLPEGGTPQPEGQPPVPGAPNEPPPAAPGTQPQPLPGGQGARPVTAPVAGGRPTTPRTE